MTSPSAGIICSAIILLAAAHDQPSFRVRTNYVHLSVTVEDERGVPVRDLNVSEFTVFEGGQPQTIGTFQRVDRHNDGRQTWVPSDVSVNDPDSPTTLYAVIVDDLNIHGSLTGRTRRLIEQLLSTMASSASVALCVTSGRVAAVDFTRDRHAIMQTASQISGIGVGDRHGDGPSGDFQKQHHTRTAMKTLRRVLDFLATVPGRKAVVLISEGYSSGLDEVNPLRGYAPSLTGDTAVDAIRAAWKHNIPIYAWDPAGLRVPDSADLYSPELVAEPRRSLQRLAEQTGGRALAGSTRIEDAVTSAVRDLETYYILGYETRISGERYVPIDVRVARPQVTVRVRRAYNPTGERPDTDLARSPDERLRDLARAAASTGSLALRLHATPYIRNGKSGVVFLFEIPGEALTFRANRGLWESRIDFRMSAVSQDGRRKARGRFLTSRLGPAALGKIQEAGLRVVSSLDLEPGMYTLHLSVVDGREAGVVVTSVEVPDFRHRSVFVGPPRIIQQPRGGSPIVFDESGDELETWFGVPTTAREFIESNGVNVVGEIYSASSTRTGWAVSIESAAGRTSVLSEGEVTTGVTRYSTTLPDNLPPGEYRLLVTRRDGAAGSPVVATLRIAEREQALPR